MAAWTLAFLLDRLSGRLSYSPWPTLGAFVLALPNSSSGLSFPELPSLHRRHWKPWIHRRLRRHNPRRRRPSEPAPSSRSQLVWPSTPNISAAASPSTPRTGLISTPRTVPAPSMTNFYGFLRLQRRPYCPRRPHRHRFALGAPRHRHSRPTIAFYRTIGLHQRFYHSSANATTLSPRAWSTLPDHSPLAFSSDRSWSPYTIRSLNDPGLSRPSSSLQTARFHTTPPTNLRACNVTRQGA